MAGVWDLSFRYFLIRDSTSCAVSSWMLTVKCSPSERYSTEPAGVHRELLRRSCAFYGEQRRGGREMTQRYRQFMSSLIAWPIITVRVTKGSASPYYPKTHKDLSSQSDKGKNLHRKSEVVRSQTTAPPERSLRRKHRFVLCSGWLLFMEKIETIFWNCFLSLVSLSQSCWVYKPLLVSRGFSLERTAPIKSGIAT